MEKGKGKQRDHSPGIQESKLVQGYAWNNHMDYDTLKKGPEQLFDFSRITSFKLKNGPVQCAESQAKVASVQ